MTQVISRYEKLREALTGSIVTPDDPGYDDARQVWNGDIDRRPAVVAYCQTAEDVARAVSFAREASLEISVRSGGAHSTSGMGVGDAGIVVDVSRMNQVAVDPQAVGRPSEAARCNATSTRPPRPTGWPCRSARSGIPGSAGSPRAGAWAGSRASTG